MDDNDKLKVFQLKLKRDLLKLLTRNKKIPYSDEGFGKIRVMIEKNFPILH